MAEEWVYAVREKRDRGAPVKFGVSSNFDRRFATLQTGSPFPLAKLAWVPGGKRLEAAVHALLAPWRTSGEWFGNGDVEVTVVAGHLKDAGFREAVIRWVELPPDFQTFVRRVLGLEDNDLWLVYIADRLRVNLPRLLHFIDECALHGKQAALPAGGGR